MQDEPIPDLTGSSGDRSTGPSDPATLRRFVDDAPVAIAMLDADLRYLAASRRWLADCGIAADRFLGRCHYDLFPELPDAWKQVHRRCLAGASEEYDRELLVRSDGKRQWVRWAVRPWHSAPAVVGGLLIFSEDVTARVEAEDSLRAESDLRRLALEAAGAGVWTYEVATNTSTWDDRSHVLFGFAAEQPRSFDAWVSLLHREDRDRVLARLNAVRQTPGDDVWNMEYRARRPDGTMVWVQALGRVDRDANGVATRLTGLNLDITARKTLEEALRQSRERERESVDAVGLLLQTASQAILYVDANGSIETVNRAAEALFGWPARELVGRPVEVLLPNSLQETHAQHRAAYFAAPRPRPMGLGLDLLGERKDGSTFPAEVSLNHVLMPSGARAVAFVTDISVRKEAERALRESHAALETYSRELERRADRLGVLAAELTVAEQRAREQLAKTLHDGLQQLLFSSRLKVDRLEARLARGADAASLVAGVRQELDEAIAQARSLAVELFPASLHAQGLAAGLHWLASWIQQKYGLTVNLTVDPAADPGRRDVRTLVFESVRELLFNVVKHAHVDHVSMTLARTDTGTVRITVTDEGVGFDPAVAFDAVGGHHQGLGLFGIRERLTLLGGKFDVRSAPGEGTTFTLLAPHSTSPEHHAAVLRADDGGDARPAATASSEAGPLRILIADDHALVRDGLRELLAGRPELEVVGEAADGFEAVVQARSLKPDVIVMDVSMPNLDGVEATRRVRAELPHVLIFGLSTEERPQGQHAIEAAGANGYFTKSDDAEHLVARLMTVHAAGVTAASAGPASSLTSPPPLRDASS